MIKKTKLSEFILRRGFKTAKVIKISGYSKKTVYTYLNGTVDPPEDFKKRVSDFLETPITELF